MNGTLTGLSAGMNPEEETTVHLKDAGPEQEDAGPEDVPAPVVPEADATEADVSEADLDQEDQEKQPMTGGADRAEDAPTAGGEEAAAGEERNNGSVNLKIPEEEEKEQKFTGLNKEELMKVAGTPGWVRTRWALLVVFWLGWLGMLGGAVLIILQAPRCRELPATNWWNNGPLYQIGDVRAFSDARDLKGVEQKISNLAQMKVRGLVLGPIHEAPADQVMSLSFEKVSSESGTLDQFRSLIQAAHKKSIFVVLDLTPNYQGSSGPWFSNVSVTNVAERLKSGLVFWMNQGVDGVQLSGVERVAGVVPSLWTDIRAIVQNGTEERPNKRVLIGVTERSSAEDVSVLLSSTGVDLLISRVLCPGSTDAKDATDATELAQSVQLLYSSHNQTKLAWSLGGRAEGHLASLVGPALVKLHQLLLLTLPGTPVINYGDEIGLMDGDTKFPRMLWDSDGKLNGTLQERSAEHLACLSFFSALSELRGKERSLLFGDFLLLSNSSSSLAYLRVWDQSPGFLAAFNWAEDEAAVLQLSGAALPRQAAVVFSTNSSVLPVDSSVDLMELRLGPGQAALLRFPYTG
ncbi:4F2 cell-surface antigen heavy chain-like [Sebastes umbrosus]|uniref:4F2 cell-surface antigen heavy chain-like n=1 Tax=Sebastes umbrosus TaxID=72105 RepID=UPI0018A0D20D|nr:4F2 cell-surface antigen heavy chain-like [Sebastes umbrosus]